MPLRAFVTAVAMLSVCATSCCCCSSDWLDLPEIAMPSDEPAIEAEARRYAAENASAIVGGVDGGAGSGECFSGGGELAAQLGAAVLTRGHAGADAAGSAQFDLAACARRVIVHVVMRAGAWVAVGAIVIDANTASELFRIGAPVRFSPIVDSDDGIDELF